MSGELVPATGGVPATTGDQSLALAESGDGALVRRSAEGNLVTPSSDWSDDQHYATFGRALEQQLSKAGVRDRIVVQRVVATARAALSEGNELETPFHALAPFAARLAQAGESAATIRAALSAAASYLAAWFGSQRGGDEYDDTPDRDEASKTMRQEWGREYDMNRRLCVRYLESLPPVVQIALENARLTDGSLALNAPNMLRWLVSQARGPVRAGVGTADEKAEIEELMRDRGSRYWRGPQAAQLQARYRDLLGATSERPMPSGSAVDREIAEIEQVMRTQRSRYNRDERMQARYRALLEKREQS